MLPILEGLLGIEMAIYWLDFWVTLSVVDLLPNLHNSSTLVDLASTTPVLGFRAVEDLSLSHDSRKHSPVSKHQGIPVLLRLL